MTFTRKEDVGWIGRATFASKYFDPVLRVLSKVFQYFEYMYLEYLKLFL